LTAAVELDSVIGQPFYEKTGFIEPTALTQDVQGYALDLLDYRCPNP